MKEKKVINTKTEKMNTERYTFVLKVNLPVCFKCDYCGYENEFLHTISKSKVEIVSTSKELDPDGNMAVVSENKKDEIFDILEHKANEEKNIMLNLYDNQTYSMIAKNECINCHKQSSWSLKYAFKTHLISKILIYFLLIIVSLLLNIVLKETMISLLNNSNTILTSIFFFPLVMFFICLIALLFDIKALNKKYDYKHNVVVNRPIIDKNKIYVEKNIYHGEYEQRLK